MPHNASMKFDEMSDQQISQMIEDLTKEFLRRSGEEAKSVGIQPMPDPVFGPETFMRRIILETPMGHIVFVKGFMDATIVLNETPIDVWVRENAASLDEKWVDMVREEQHAQDAVEVLCCPRHWHLTEGVRIYKKWEPLFQLMMVSRVHEG